ncbi:MAG TPA: ferric reductase-like transmembrane domain-containing protein [Amycolatopsis sp.]|uniref:ferric reductase-like transmembrane domain-containing protein n=1 Tax=Amycolatopsis sp. TaxID=37632 RepID=UPI002B459E3C|nr:ferric reductase-like transmembrane domain-containing protein [Amycolatopsis sp.]HKS45183.1 ferric reductase-like transmembrane domain-containing protein [Amycolatopsis sp.]
MYQLAVLAASESPHDAGVHQVAALSARMAFAFMCLGLSWGTFTSTGWLYRLTGRQATRSSHIVFVTLAIAFATIHALAFLFMENDVFGLDDLFVPMMSRGLPEALGTVSLELMLAIWLSNALQRMLRYGQWLRLHRLGYPAVALGVLHSFVGAAIDGHLEPLWISGLAIAVPTALVVALRFLPPGLLTRSGLVKAER